MLECINKNIYKSYTNCIIMMIIIQTPIFTKFAKDAIEFSYDF